VRAEKRTCVSVLSAVAGYIITALTTRSTTIQNGDEQDSAIIHLVFLGEKCYLITRENEGAVNRSVEPPFCVTTVEIPGVANNTLTQCLEIQGSTQVFREGRSDFVVAAPQTTHLKTFVCLCTCVDFN